jgi:hypothetical protein
VSETKLDQTFEKLVDATVEHEKTVAEAMHKQSKPRPWMNLSSSDLKTPAEDKDEETLHDVFDRKESDDAYVEARQNKDAKANETAAPKLTADFLAGWERDKRMQWRSRIRMVAHAMGRRAGNGQDGGPLRRNTVDYLERIFLKAEEKEAKPTNG